MYFVLLGKNKELSMEEIKGCLGEHSIDFVDLNSGVVFFKSLVSGNCFSNLAGIVKWGVVLEDIKYVKDYILSIGSKLLGTNDLYLANLLKCESLIKRFKIIDIYHTDKEIRDKGVEVLVINGKFLLVNGYQNIKIYETIDFGRPVRSMKIGMMPSKLAHLMINLVSECRYKGELWDPFCGLGTTLFMADWLGFDKIRGSDINTSPSKQNLKWWKREIKPDSKIEIFKYDVLKPFNKSFLKNVNRIVTEGYLGPIVKGYLSYESARRYELEISEIYISLFKNIFPHLFNLKGSIFCLPVYKLKGNNKEYFLEHTIEKLKILVEKYKFKLEVLPNVYRRFNQKVGRQIIKIVKG